MQELFTPASSLTITQKDGEVDLTDDQNRKRVFYTDGHKVQKSKADNYREVAAHWEGNRLVSEDKGPRGGTVRRSFEVAPGGEQLYQKLQLTDPRSGSLVVIRYVYDSIPETKQRGAAEARLSDITVEAHCRLGVYSALRAGP